MITEKLKYGPNTLEVEKFIKNLYRLSPEEIDRYNEIYDAFVADYDAAAAYDAYDAFVAAYDAMPTYDAFAAAYDAFAFAFARAAAFALTLKPLVGTNGLTQEHYDLLTEICTVINFETTEEEVRILAYRSKMQFTLRGLLLHPKATEETKVVIALKLGGME